MSALISNGLLQDTLERTVAEQVVVVPSKACEGLTAMIGKRKEEIGVLKDELFTLEGELRRS